MSYPTINSRAISDVLAERDRQDAKWGEQNHPDHDPNENRHVEGVEYAFRAQRWKDINEQRMRQEPNPARGGRTHQLAWDGILLEETYEALAEDDPAKLRAELIQVAAVALCWVEAIDRRARSGDSE